MCISSGDNTISEDICPSTKEIDNIFKKDRTNEINFNLDFLCVLLVAS